MVYAFNNDGNNLRYTIFNSCTNFINETPYNINKILLIQNKKKQTLWLIIKKFQKLLLVFLKKKK